MKILGRAAFNAESIVNDNYDDAIGYIVQLNGKECLELYRLSQSLMGFDVDGRLGVNLENKMLKDVDLSQALKAISEFASVKLSVEEVKDALQRLDNVLMVKEK